MAEAALSVFVVMPRGMYFGASRATSIDLCVKDLVRASQFRSGTKLFVEPVDDPFPGFQIEPLPSSRYAATRVRSIHVARAARRERPDVILVQQHLPTAAAIARRLPEAKIVLQTHNFQKSFEMRGGPFLDIRRSVKKHLYQRLAGIIHVSEACAGRFADDWPDVETPCCVVNNGLDLQQWRPLRERRKEVLFVGRCAPEKGVADAAFAIAATLSRYPDWRARFILSNIDQGQDYFRQVQAALSGVEAQTSVETQRPFAEVKTAFERAAIAIVPSKWHEPFGRTALEAHAGGAALITSGTGGLAEISGPTAMTLSDVSPQSIAGALETLIRNEKLRQQLAAEGAVRVKRLFDIGVQAARLDGFLVEVADGGARAARR